MRIFGKKIDVTNLVIHILFCCLTILMIYPFISMLSVSLTGEEELIYYGYRVWPEHPNLDAYKIVLRGFKPVLNALLTSLFVCVTGTLMCVFVNSTFAYTVSRRSFPAARIVNFLLLFTMFVGGGTAASYIVNINWLKLKNNLLILANALSTLENCFTVMSKAKVINNEPKEEPEDVNDFHESES